ncbi:hypothetical protein D7D52_29760 [Nocardia yunnanensis]|uniref:Uncharacterized protein n=1 Tax=Nocardia yunnanensis TaxID=2382165 RepID=A0A386ZL49_9NOCA|nr:hypothetical protein [Nocardia yunnanensis]AYF77315.1 hypothetical protein D7D52_29760 [Nocardia yunnanensis]
MIRVTRHLAAATLASGALLLAAAPAHAQPADPQQVSTTEISTGSADLSHWFCGTIWRPVCF